MAASDTYIDVAILDRELLQCDACRCGVGGISFVAVCEGGGREGVVQLTKLAGVPALL
jgi:hypothetical protein